MLLRNSECTELLSRKTLVEEVSLWWTMMLQSFPVLQLLDDYECKHIHSAVFVVVPRWQASCHVWRRYGLSMVMVHFLNHSLCNTRSNAPHLHPADWRLSLGVRWVWISVSPVCRSCWTTSLTLPCPETRPQCAVIFRLLFCYAAPAKNIWMSHVDLSVFKNICKC